MNYREATIEALADTIDYELEACRRQGRDFSILTFVTRSDIDPEERKQLLAWAQLVLCNHLPAGALVASWPGESACVALLPGVSRSDADLIGQTYGEQLNKFPVGGAAPGGAWSWGCVSLAEQTASLRELAAKVLPSRD